MEWGCLLKKYPIKPLWKQAITAQLAVSQSPNKFIFFFCKWCHSYCKFHTDTDQSFLKDEINKDDIPELPNVKIDSDLIQRGIRDRERNRKKYNIKDKWR